MSARNLKLGCWLVSCRRAGGFLWLAFGCNACQADVLYFSSDAPPVSGRLVVEDANGVQFDVRQSSGALTRERFASKDVLRVIRTVTLESRPNLDHGTPSELFSHAENLLAMHHDIEARHEGHEILSKLLKTDNLNESWKKAIYRLRLHSMPPGLARERLRREIIDFGWNTEIMSFADEETEPWLWFVKRLSADNKLKWKLALREDRSSSTDAGQESARVPRAAIERAIRQSQIELVVGDPVQVWMGELLTEMAADDRRALATLARLECVLTESNEFPTP
ncbi:MAG: hypothetical protein JNL67_09645 [Planctomycetaceae bacterium]|nr:hypothetical protein [Planctomycetaceae bacterium]